MSWPANIGLQRTAHLRLAAAEAGSFGGVVAVGMFLLLVAGAKTSLAQVPSWAENREFDVKDVQMAVSRPSGGFQQMSSDGRAIDDSNFFRGFTVTVYGGGRVVREDDTEKGPAAPQTITQELSREVIYQLLDKFVRARFFDLPAEYHGGAAIGGWLPNLFKTPPPRFHFREPHRVTDSTYLKLRLKIADHEKVITDWSSEGPKELDEIARDLEEVGKVRQKPK
jgi:hypothetical protein